MQNFGVFVGFCVLVFAADLIFGFPVLWVFDCVAGFLWFGCFGTCCVLMFGSDLRVCWFWV